MEKSRIILNEKRFQFTLQRLCHELIEHYGDFEDTCIIGIQEGGVALGKRLVTTLREITGIQNWEFGKLDITFYRDDFRVRSTPLKASETDIDFLVENKRVILVDDVLYTGRTIQAALSAIQHYGRPSSVELMTLVDRRFNRHLPVHSDYTGIQVDALDDAYVLVKWKEIDGKDSIVLFPNKKEG